MTLKRLIISADGNPMHEAVKSAISKWVYFCSLAFVVMTGAMLLTFAIRLHSLEREVARVNAAISSKADSH